MKICRSVGCSFKQTPLFHLRVPWLRAAPSPFWSARHRLVPFPPITLRSPAAFQERSCPQAFPVLWGTWGFTGGTASCGAQDTQLQPPRLWKSLRYFLLPSRAAGCAVGEEPLMGWDGGATQVFVFWTLCLSFCRGKEEYENTMVFLFPYFERRMKAMSFFHDFFWCSMELWGSCPTDCSWTCWFCCW